MKSSFARRCLLASFVWLCAVSFSSAQEEKKSDAAPIPIAVVDITRIFKSYPPIEAKFAPLKASVKELEEKVQLRQVEIDTLQRKLLTPGVSNEDRERGQVQLVKLQSELRIFLERERQSLANRERSLQAETYKSIQAETAKIAKERGYRLVLVRPKFSLDSNNSGEVALALNQFILYDDGIDITDDVIKLLEAQEAAKKSE